MTSHIYGKELNRTFFCLFSFLPFSSFFFSLAFSLLFHILSFPCTWETVALANKYRLLAYLRKDRPSLSCLMPIRTITTTQHKPLLTKSKLEPPE